MSNRMPSLFALLGLAAVAGYQNRDALRDMLGTAGGPASGSGSTPVQPGEQQGWLDQIIDRARHSLGGSTSPLSAGLGELIDRFTRSGSGETAQSWVGTGQNRVVTPDEVRAAVGPEVIDELTRQTGMTETNLLSRLAQSLPELVDRSTPDGRLPDVAVTLAEPRPVV